MAKTTKPKVQETVNGYRVRISGLPGLKRTELSYADDLTIRGYSSQTRKYYKGQQALLFAGRSKVATYDCNLMIKREQGTPARCFDPDQDWMLLQETSPQPQGKPLVKSHLKGDRGLHGTQYAKDDVTVDQIMKEIDRKILTGFRGIEQRFLNKEGLGSRVLAREEFNKLLYDLFGYMSKEQNDALLERLGVQDRDQVSLDDFMRSFKENKTVKELWCDSKRRKVLKEDSFKRPADKLKDDEVGRSETKSTKDNNMSSQMMNSKQTLVVLRKMAKESPAKMMALFTDSLQAMDGIITKSILSRIVADLGIDMYLEDFENLWNRFDFARIGFVPSQRFFRLIGLSPSTNKADKNQGSNARDVVNSPTVSPGPLVSPDTKENASKAIQKESGTSLDIKGFLSRKLREGGEKVVNAWKRIVQAGERQTTKDEFRLLLEQFNIFLTSAEVASFLIKYGVRGDSFDFLHWLSKFERVVKSKLTRLPRGPCRASFSAGNRIERILADILFKEYMTLSKEFRFMDASRSGFISLDEFVALLRKTYSVSVTAPHVRASLAKYGLIRATKVDYTKLLATCSSSKRPLPNSVTRSSPVKVGTTHEENEDRDLSKSLSNLAPFVQGSRLDSALMQLSRADTRKCSLSTSFDDNESARAKSIDTLLHEIRKLLEENLDSMNKSADSMHTNRRGFVTKDDVIHLCHRFGLDIKRDDVNRLWPVLPLSKSTDDASICYYDLVQYLLTYIKQKPELADENNLLSFSMVSEKPQSGDLDNTTSRIKSVEKTADVSGVTEKEHVKLATSHPLSRSQSRQLQHSRSSPNIQSRQELSSEDGDMTRTLSSSSVTVRLEDSRDRIRITSKSRIGTICEKVRKPLLDQWWLVQRRLAGIDTDGLGCINGDQLKELMSSIQVKLKDEEVDHIQKEFGSHLSPGLIDYVELFRLIKRRVAFVDDTSAEQSSKHKTEGTRTNDDPYCNVINNIRKKFLGKWKGLRRVFRKADLNQDGFLSQSEFQIALENLGVHLCEEDLYHIFSTFDDNLDNRISYDEFFRHVFEV